MGCVSGWATASGCSVAGHRCGAAEGNACVGGVSIVWRGSSTRGCELKDWLPSLQVHAQDRTPRPPSYPQPIIHPHQRARARTRARIHTCPHIAFTYQTHVGTNTKHSGPRPLISLHAHICTSAHMLLRVSGPHLPCARCKLQRALGLGYVLSSGADIHHQHALAACAQRILQQAGQLHALCMQINCMCCCTHGCVRAHACACVHVRISCARDWLRAAQGMCRGKRG